MLLDEFKKYSNQCDLKALSSIIEQRKIWIDQNPKKQYSRLIKDLPEIEGTSLKLEDNKVFLSSPNINDDSLRVIKKVCHELIPWRKGPFNLFGIEIDAEWRSDLKWERIKEHIGTITDKKVLDIGCNNGFYMFNMLHENPLLLLGIDPVPLYFAQFQVIQKQLQAKNMFMELLGVEHLNHFSEMFDLILYMGIIYHHRNPIEQLINIHNSLVPGGSVVFETIGIPGNEPYNLFPADRYAKMKNVWFIPTISAFYNMIKKSKFIDIEIISDTLLTPNEQRNTDWCPSPFQTLLDFLDPENHTKTIEGYPAPRRFSIIAKKR